MRARSPVGVSSNRMAEAMRAARLAEGWEGTLLAPRRGHPSEEPLEVFPEPMTKTAFLNAHGTRGVEMASGYTVERGVAQIGWHWVVRAEEKRALEGAVGPRVSGSEEKGRGLMGWGLLLMRRSMLWRFAVPPSISGLLPPAN